MDLTENAGPVTNMDGVDAELRAKIEQRIYEVLLSTRVSWYLPSKKLTELLKKTAKRMEVAFFNTVPRKEDYMILETMDNLTLHSRMDDLNKPRPLDNRPRCNNYTRKMTVEEVVEEVIEEFKKKLRPEYTVGEAVEVLDAMDQVPKNSDLRYFASTVIVDEAKREFFMNLDPDERLWWLLAGFQASKKANYTARDYTIGDALQVLNAMDQVPKKSDLRYFASTVIVDEVKRNFFINLDPDERLRWLQAGFQETKKAKN